MATAPSQIEPARAGPSIVTAPPAMKSSRSKWLRWGAAAGFALALAVAGLFWRAHLRNAVTYEIVPVERGSKQARITATGNLNAVVDVLVSSQVSGNVKALYADWNSKLSSTCNETEIQGKEPAPSWPP